MSMTRWWLYIQIANIFHAKFIRGAQSEVCLLGCPGNGPLVPRSQTAPRNALPVPRNRSDIPRNAKIVPGSILAPGNDPAVPGNAGAVPGNAENQNAQVSFPYASRLLFGKAESPRGDMDLEQHSLFLCFDVPAHLLMRGHP